VASAEDWEELAGFLIGKTIAGLRYDDGKLCSGIDLIFADGSELELYCLSTKPPEGPFYTMDEVEQMLLHSEARPEQTEEKEEGCSISWVQVSPEEAQRNRDEREQLDAEAGDDSADGL